MASGYKSIYRQKMSSSQSHGSLSGTFPPLQITEKSLPDGKKPPPQSKSNDTWSQSMTSNSKYISPRTRQSLNVTYRPKPKGQITTRASYQAVSRYRVEPNREQKKAGTFGDLERVCVKAFFEEFQQKAAEDYDRSLGLENYVLECLSTLGDIYQESALGTESLNNVLRAIGLLNIRIMESSCEQTKRGLVEKLTEFEYTVLRRIVKMKQADLSLNFQYSQSREPFIEDLDDMRDLYLADFSLLSQCVDELQTQRDVDDSKTATTKNLLAEEKIIAVSSVMEAEAVERYVTILAQILHECIKMMGAPLPCNYTLIKAKRLGSTSTSPFAPWHCVLLIEKESASIRSYFRNLLTMFAMKVLDIGETGLSDLKIRSLNWYIAERPQASAFGISNLMDEVEKRSNSSAMIDSLKTPTELMRAASSNRRTEREEAFRLCDGARYISGNTRMFKDLQSVRQSVIQREQADGEYKQRMFASLQRLVQTIDPFHHLELSDNAYEETMQQKVLQFPDEFINIMLSLEKNLKSETTHIQLQEVTSMESPPLYSSLSVETVMIRKDNSLRSRFAEDVEDVERRYRNRSQLAGKEFGKQRIDGDSEISLSEVRVSFSQNHSQEDGDERYEHKAFKAERQKRKAMHSSDKPVSKKLQPRNASNRVAFVPKPVPKPELPPPSPEPEPCDRLVNSVPIYEGGGKGLLSTEAGRNFALLHSLAKILNQTKITIGALSTSHRPPQLSNKTFMKAYNKVLRLMFPLTEYLKTVVKSPGSVATLKKLLFSMEYSPDEGKDIALAMSHFHTREYRKCSEAIYRYIESESDITFVGEPDPWDFKDVCEEMLSSGALTEERYQLLLVMLAQCQMRRRNHQDSLHYWKEVLPLVSSQEKCAGISMNMLTCYLELENWTEALEAAHRTIRLYRGAAKSSQKYMSKISQLERMVTDLQMKVNSLTNASTRSTSIAN